MRRAYRQQQPRQRARHHACLASPAHEEQLFRFPFCAAVGKRADQHGDRPGQRHEKDHHDDAAGEIAAHEAEIDLGAEQDEDEGPEDQGGGGDEILHFFLFVVFHPESEHVLVAEQDAENEYRHEAAGVKAVRAEVGAENGHQRDDRRMLLEESEFLVRDQQGGEITRHCADQDADGCLPEKGHQRVSEGKFAVTHGHAENGKCGDRPHRIVEGRLGKHGLRNPVPDLHLSEYRYQRGGIGGSEDECKQQRYGRGKGEHVARDSRGDAGSDEDAQGGKNAHGDPDFLQHIEPQARPAVEEDVGSAEYQNDLVQCRIHADVDKPGHFGSQKDAGNQEKRNVRDSQLFGQDADCRACAQNEGEGQENVLCKCDRGHGNAIRDVQL